MQLSRKSVIKFAAENPDLVVDGLLKYTVTVGKVKSQHQVQVKAEDVEKYAMAKAESELQEVDEVLNVASEYLTDDVSAALRERKQKAEDMIDKMKKNENKEK